MLNLNKIFSIFILILSLMFSACGGSDGSDENNNGDPSSGIPQGKSGIVGVWIGYDWNGYTNSLRYIVFYEDGAFRFTLPEKGFVGFDKAKDKIDNHGKNIWGTYTFSGKTGTWKYDAEGAKSPDSLTLESDGGLNLGTTLYKKFYRCAIVDNYKLNSSYTPYSDPTDLTTFYSSGDRPVISFKSDGTFVDEGLYKFDDLNLFFPYFTKKGSGTYELKDYTLILNYSDSTKVQASFTFKYGTNIKDASDSIIFNNRSFYQMP